MTIFTIGHSTRPIIEFIEILRTHGIRLVVDVRTIPGSRRNPQYGKDELEQTLRQEQIAYRHMPGLGGLRRPRKDSINTGWENDSFRGYADYMQSEEFARGLDQLVEIAGKKTTAIMCAEAVPWRCHRSLIADALLVRGISVLDIMSRTSVKEHSLTPWAETEGERITYPGPRPTERLQRKRKRGSQP
jgi:uncharacterized protein (DUF488 family)